MTVNEPEFNILVRNLEVAHKFIERGGSIEHVDEGEQNALNVLPSLALSIRQEFTDNHRKRVVSDLLYMTDNKTNRLKRLRREPPNTTGVCCEFDPSLIP